MVIQPPQTLVSGRRPVNATPPTFEKPPTVGRFIEGGDAHFECRVRGNPTPEVVWSRRGMPIQNDTKRQVSYNPTTGVCTFDIKGLTAEDDGEYTCTAVNCVGEASLTVSINRDISNQVVSQDGFSTTKWQTGRQTGQVTQQRQITQTYVQKQTDGMYHRTTSADYEMDQGGPMYYSGSEGFRVDTFEYRLLREIEFRELLFKKQPGEDMAIQKDAPLDKAQPPSAPQIATRPRNSKLLEGSEATFQAKITGNPRPKITWFKNGQRILASQRFKMTYTDNTASLHIHMALPEDAGYYTLLAENSNGRIACSAHLVIEGVGTPVDTRVSYQRADSQLAQQRPATPGTPGTPTSFLHSQGFQFGTHSQNIVSQQSYASSQQTQMQSISQQSYAASRQTQYQSVSQQQQSYRQVQQQQSLTQQQQQQSFSQLQQQPLPQLQQQQQSLSQLQFQQQQQRTSTQSALSLQQQQSQIQSKPMFQPSSPTFFPSEQVKQAPTTPTMVQNDVDTTSSKALKPNFVKIPQDKEVTEGKMVRFDLRVSGRPFPDVSWYLNGKQVVDDTTHKLLVNEGGIHALMITSANRTDSGTYTCVAKNKSGDVQFTVNLHVIEKEQIVAPKFVERFQSMHAREGEPVTLHCRAVGTPIPQITWQKDGVQIHSQPPMCIIETVEGSSSLYFNQVTMADSAWYQCTAQNQAGSTATRARLYVESELTPMAEPWRLNLPRPHKVIEPEGSPPREVVWLKPVERAAPRPRPMEEERPPQKPAFTTHLQDLNLQEGDRANFDARLVPIGDPSMVIEWFVNGKAVEASSRVMTTYRFGYVALTLLHVYAEDSGVYMCRAFNEAGEATTTATLRCSPRAPIERAPQHPESMEAIRHLEDWEKYQRQVSVEEVVSTQKPVFIKPLNHLENLLEGGFAHFEAQITPVSDPSMKVEWLLNGQTLTAGTRISTTFSFGYVALNISYVRAEDSGVYMCKATNQKGEAISTGTLKVKVSEQVTGSLGIPEQEVYIQKTQELEAYQLLQRQTHVEVDQFVNQKPFFKTQLLDKLDIDESKTAHFEARLEPSGDSTMRVEWLKDGRPIEASSRITTFFNFGYVSLTIRGVDLRDTGTYTCIATNSMGTSSSTAKLVCISKKSVVLESQHAEGLQKIQHLEDSSRYQRDTMEEVSFTQKPRFADELTGKTQLVEGQSVHFETRLEPMGDPSMIVEWYFNGKSLTTGHRFKTYFDFGYVALDILYVFPEDSGTFTVVARNAMGEARLSKQVTIQAKSSVDTTTIHEIEEKIEYLERPPHREPHYDIDDYTKCKPHFPIPLHNPKPLKEGDRVHLECRVEPAADPTLTIEWFFNGKSLPSASRFQVKSDFGHVCLDITSAYPEDTGEYTVRAKNQLGSAHTSACITVIGKKSIVTETQHPAGLEKIQYLEDSSRYKREQFEDVVITQMPTFTKPLHNVETIEGMNIHLECRLAPVGDPTMKVDWFVNGAALKIGHRFRPAYEFDYVALDVLSVYPEDSGVYTCKATSSLGQAVTSCTVKCTGRSQIISESQHPEGLQQIQYLEDSSRFQRDVTIEESVKIQPRFISKLNHLTLKEGQLAHFECRLEPLNDSSLRIEWFRNGKSLPVGHRYRPFHDFGYAALNILSVVPEDSGTYTCRAINIMGSAEVQATLTCVGKSSIISETQHPEGLQKIQMLEDYSRYQRDVYQEEFTTQAPVFTTSPHNVEIKEGQRVHFECKLIPVGDPKLRVEWFHNGKTIKAGTRFVETFNFGYVALDIMYAFPEDSGTYTCKAINALGEAVTSVTLKCLGKSALILESQQPESLEKIQILEDASRRQRAAYVEETTTQAPVFTQPMKNLQLMENQSAHFECRLIPVGDTKLKVEWFHNGIAIMPASRVTLTHDFGFVALDLAYVKPEDSGTYSCKATNELGQAVCSATLAVKGSSSLNLETQHPEGLQKIQYLEDSTRFQRDTTEDVKIASPPIFVTALSGPTKLVEGNSSHLECRVEPYPDPTMKVEWFFNGKPLPSGSRYRTLFDFGFAALDILTVNAEDSGEYTIKATNCMGTASSTARITVSAKSSLILESQQPDALPKIQRLEDPGRHRTAVEIEPTFEKPNFGRPLYNLDNLVEGHSAHLEATVTPVNDPSMRVEWFFNGMPIKHGHRFKTTFDFGYVALDILYVFPEDCGTYMCKATNNQGEAITTCSIKVQAKGSVYTDTLHEEGLEKIRQLEETYKVQEEEPVIQVSRPIFITPLKNQEGIKEGQPIHLECKLEPVNDPKLTVEWFVNGVKLRSGHRFKTIHDFGYVSLDILYAFPEDNGTYMCKAVNELGEAVTTCTVRVEARRSIYYDTQHPEGLEKIRELECQEKYRLIEVEEKEPCKPYFVSELRGITEYTEGNSAHLEARVEPSYDAQLKVEFFHNGKPLDAASRFHVTFDFGYVSLDVSHVLPEHEGTYVCKATNNLGQATSSITIRVHGKSSIISDTQHPEGLAKIQALEEKDFTQPEYIEKRTFQRPVFTVPLQNLDLVEGQAAHLECRLIPVGDPAMKVEWFINDKPLQPSSRVQTTHDFGYVALDIQYARPDDNGDYTCRATNELGEAVTIASVRVKTKAFIDLQTQHPEGLEKIQEMEGYKAAPIPEAPEARFEKPVFTTPIYSPSEVVEGQPAHFECRVVPVGDPDLKIHWFVNGVALKSAARFREIHDFGMVSLDITSVIPEDAGVYMCKAVNKAGDAVVSTSMNVKARSSIFCDVQHPETYEKTQKFEFAKVPEVFEERKVPRAPIFTVHLTNQEKLIEGQYVRLEAHVEPTDDEKLQIEWFKNGKTFPLGTRVRTTIDFGLVALDIVTVRPDDSGIYTCRAWNEVGEAITTCTLKVEGRENIIYGSQHPDSLPKIQELESIQLTSPEYQEAAYDVPIFISHLNNLELKEGLPAHFECRVEPFKDPKLTIEFLLNGKALPLATRFTVSKDFGYITLDITHVLTEDAGIYTCRAKNNKGEAVTTGSLKVITDDETVIEKTTHPMGQEGLSKVRQAEQMYSSKYQVPMDEKEVQFPKPVFVVPLEEKYTVNESHPIRIECRVEPSTDPRLNIEWYFNGKSISIGTRYQFTHDFGQVVLDARDMWQRDNGVYTCRAYNDAGEAFTSTTIQCISKDGTVFEGTLHPEGEKGLESIQLLEDSLMRPMEPLPDEKGHPPVFTSQFENLTNLTEDDIAHFEATLAPAGDQTMVVEWFFQNKTLKAGHRIRTVHAFGMVVLEILGVRLEDSGEYTCRATNKWGRAEITVKLEAIDRIRGQKPKFTTQLQSLIGLKEGQSAHFECHLIPVGDPTMKVEWFHNGIPMRHSSRIKTLSDFGFVVMDISFVHVEDSGEYVCVATNKFGSDTTRCTIECSGFGKILRDSLQPQSLDKIAELEGSHVQYRSQLSMDTTLQPPKFTTQIREISNLVESQSAHFEAYLTPVNDPNLKVEWFFNGKPLGFGHRFRTFHDFGLVILDILYCYSEDTGEYSCKATNRLGTDITKTTLSCRSKSSIILDPQFPKEMPSGTEHIMQLEESLYRTRGEYVEELHLEAPKFTVPLENQSNLREGENAHLEARLTPTDDPDLRVEWFKNGKTIRAGTRIKTINDFGFVVLEISPVYPEDSGLYSCRATNKVGEAVTTCTIKIEGKRSVIMDTQLPEGMESIQKIARFEDLSSERISEQWMDVDVNQPPVFLTKPPDLVLPENSLAHFECRLSPVNDPTMKVEWYQNGKPLVTGTRVKTISDFGFVILEVAGVFTRDNGVYVCKATNKLGEASVSATLTVKAKHSIIMEPQLPTEWRSGTESLQKLEEAMYRTEEIIMDEDKKQPPQFTTQIQNLDDKVEGESAHFECRLIPVGDPTMRVEWFLNGKPLTTGTRVHTVDDFGFVVLDIDWLFPRDAGEYMCRATNRWGHDTTKAVLKVKSKRDIIMDSQLPSGMSADKLRDLEYPQVPEAPAEELPHQPPKFITQIQPQDNLQEGESAHFECRLEPVNDPKLRVEWYHNGKPLKSGHRFKTTHDFGFVALDVLYVYAEDSGEYIARAVNDYGEDTTKATLKIKAKPPLEYKTQLPKSMETGVQKIAEMEASWQRVVTQEDVPPERCKPMFVMKPEPQVVIEGEWAKFCCRVIGNPKPRIMWIVNGNTICPGSRYKLTYDGIYHLDVPKSRQYDQGKVEVFARNAMGEAYCWTTLEVRPRHDDYRLVLKNSPRQYTPRTPDWALDLESKKKDMVPQAPTFETTLRDLFVKQEGKKITMECIVKGHPRPKVTWYRNDKVIDITSGYYVTSHIEDRTMLIILKVTKDVEGKYSCKIANDLGEEISTAYLHIGVTREEHEELQRAAKPKEPEARTKKPKVHKAKEEYNKTHTARQFTDVGVVGERPTYSFTDQQPLEIREITAQETPSEAVPMSRPTPDKAEVEFVLSSHQTVSVAQVQTVEKENTFKPSELPGSRKLDISIPSEVAKEISEVLTQGSIKEFKTGELPNTQQAEVILPSELALMVLIVLENSSVGEMKPEEAPGSKLADVSIPAELATQVLEVLTASCISELQLIQRPGSRQADFDVPSEVVAEVSEVVPHSSVGEFKAGEIPGTKEADFSVPSDVAMQVSEVMAHGSLQELTVSVPTSSSADVSIPSELATQVLEVLSNSSVGALSTETLPGSKKVDVTLPLELAMQVYETLANSSVIELKPGEVPGSTNADIGVVEKLSVQVSQVTPEHGLGDMKEEKPLERKAKETERESLPTAQKSVAVDVLEMAAAPVVKEEVKEEVEEDVTQVIKVKKAPEVKSEETVEHVVKKIKRKPSVKKPEEVVSEVKVPEEITEEIKIPLKTEEVAKTEEVTEITVKKPIVTKEEVIEEKEVVVKKKKRKPSVQKEEKPEEISEDMTITLKPETVKKPEEETKETFAVVIPQKVTEEEIIVLEEVVASVPLKEEKEEKPQILEESVETTIKKEVVIEEEPEEVETVVKKTKKPKKKETIEEKLTVKLKPKKKVEEIKPSEEVTVPIKTEEKPEVPTEEVATITLKKEEPEKIEEITVKEKVTVEEIADETIVKKKKLKPKPEEQPEDLTFTVKQEREKPKEKSPETVEETFAIKITEKKSIPEEVVEKVEEVITLKPEIEKKDFKISEEAVEATVKKEVVIEEITEETLEIKPIIPELPEKKEPVEEKEEMVVVKKAPKPKPKVKPEEPQETFKVKLEEKKPEEEKPKEVEETFAIKMPKKEEKPIEEVEEVKVIKIEPKVEEKEFKVTEEKAEITVKKVVIVEEEEKKVVLKKAPKPKPKVKPEEPEEVFKIKLDEKKPEEQKPEDVEETFAIKMPEKVEKPVEVIEEVKEVIKVQPKVEEKEFKVSEEKAEITVKKEVIVEEKEEKVTLKKASKPKPKVKPEEPEEVFKITLDEKKPEEQKPEDVEETFEIKMPKKEEKPIEQPEDVKEIVKITPKVEKKEFKVTEEEAEITVKKEVIVEEKEEKVVLKKAPKPKPKVKPEEPEETFKIKLEEKKPEEEKPEDVEETFAIKMPTKKEEKPVEKVEEVQEVIKIAPQVEKKEFKVTEEEAEITVKKEVIVEEKEEKVTLKKAPKPKPKVKPEEPEETFKIKLEEKKPEEEKPKDVEETFAIKMPTKKEEKPVEKVEEVQEVIKIAPQVEKKEFKVTEEEAEITVKKEVIVEEKEEKITLKKAPKPKPKVKPEEPEETFKIKLEEKKPEEEKPKDVEETFAIKMPTKKEEKPVEKVEEVQEVIKLAPKVEKKEYKVTEEEAEITVKKEVIVEEKEEKVTLKKAPKPKPKVKPEEPEETFKIKLEEKKPEEEKPKDVEETFAIKMPTKKEEKPVEKVEEVQEVIKIAPKVEKKEYKVTEEEAEITVKKEVIVEEKEEKVTLKKAPKPKVKPEEPEETFKIKLEEKKPEEEKPKDVEEIFAVKMPKKEKKKEITEMEEELKVVIPKKEEVKEYKITEEAAEVTVKKTVEKTKEEKHEDVVVIKKKKETKKKEEVRSDTFTIPRKEPEPVEDTEVKFEIPKPKRKPSKTVEDEESFKLVLPAEPKKEPKISEESAEISIVKKVEVKEEEETKVAIKRPKKKRESIDKGVEETFTISHKPKEEKPEKAEDVEETFKITTPSKKKPKPIVDEDTEESISISMPAEKPAYKVEEVSEETKITLKKAEKPKEEEVEELTETIEMVVITTYVSEELDRLSVVEGEHVYLVKKTTSDWWFVKKVVTNEKGLVPSKILQDIASYTHYMKETLDKKIEKLPVLRKPKPGEKMTGPKFVKRLQSMRVLDGQTAELTCKVSGNPRPTVTWFKQTQIIKPSSEFQIFYDDDNVTTLIICEVFPEDAGTFTVVAKNAAGFSSSSAELLVEAPFSDHGSEMCPSSRLSLSRQSSLADILEGFPPVFSEKPKDKTVDEDKTVELVCKVTGVPEPKIIWLRNQKVLKETERVTIKTLTEDLDITTVVVTIKNAQPEDTGTYEIIAENCEGKSVTSLTLTVKEKPKKPKEEPPSFVQTYSDVTVTEKDVVSLTVKVQGVPPPEVTWYKNGKQVKPSKTIKQTVDKDVCTMIIENADVKDTGEYKCVAKNPKGTVEHKAKITVQKTGMDFTDKLKDVEVNERETAIFEIQVSHPDAEVTWHKDGEQIKEGDKYQFVKDRTTRKLIIKEASIRDDGEYTCVLGEKECTADLVVVELPPDFKGEMSDVTIAKTETAAFQVEMTKGDARARWYKNGEEIQFSEHVLLKIDGKRQKLVIYNATFEDAGTYTCMVGEKKRTARLEVEAPTVEFTVRLSERMTVPQDTDATFTVELSSPDVEVEWLKDGKVVPKKDKDKFRFIKEKNVYKMVVKNATKEDMAEYSCVAGNVKTTTKLTVQEASAEFTLKLRDVIVKESDTAILLVEVTRETFEVRWMKDGQTLRPSERFVMEKEGCRRRLLIRETSLDDRGMYTCVLEEKSCSSTLTVEAIPRVVTKERQFKGKKGSNVPINIEFVSLPPPKIEWLCKGKSITSGKKLTIENYGSKTNLTVKKLEDPDIGNYTLKLSNKCGECVTDFTVSIIDKPKPPGTPSASEIKKDSLTLSWKAPESDGGTPVTNYIIEYHDRSTLRWSIFNENFTIPEPFTKVTNLKDGEEYMFRVIAVNEVGKSDPSPGTKYIPVAEAKAGEPPTIVEHLQPVTTGIKCPVQMTCRITGQPTPNIKWFKNGKEVLALKNLTTSYEKQVATLKIVETNEKSAGTYTCKATNNLGSVETSAEMKIQQAPSATFDEKMKNVRLKSSSEYILKVQVSGHPLPEIVWLKNGKVLESTKHTLIQVQEDSTTITIRNVDNTDSATYTLQLSNSAGVVKYDFKLYVLDKPLRPEGPIAFHKIEKDSVTIGWQPPKVGASEVTTYLIERCEVRRKIWMEVTTVNSDTLTLEIQKLTEGIEYSFRVIATNDYGKSDPLVSDPVTPKSLFDKPLSPKGPFTTSNMTETSFTLSWLAPNNDGGSPIVEYIVERKEAHRKAWQRSGTTDGKSLSMEVTGLKKDTAYHFRVSARNDIGTSPPYAPDEPITAGLKISPPSSPVGPLTISHMTNKTLTLTWKPPANTGGAELTAYIVEKRESHKKAWNRLETLDPYITSYTVHNLSDKNEYFFRVFAENPAGLSPPLETDKPIKLTTTAERPSPPTAPLEMVATGPCTILIEWGRPESDGGSPILGYTVALKDTRRIMWMEVGQVDGEMQRLQIRDLVEGHEYMVRIMAKNEIGVSDPLESEEPVKVIRPPGFKESERPEVDEKTMSISYSTETTSSWIREANVEPLLRSYTKHVLAGRNEYFFKLWHFAESLYK